MAQQNKYKKENPSLTREQIIDIVIEESKRMNIDPSLVLAVIEQESSFKVDAKGSKNEIGLMQLMPAVWSSYAKSNPAEFNDPSEPRQNIKVGIQEIKSHLDRYQGDVKFALAAYNWGSGNLAKSKKIPKVVEGYIGSVLQKKSRWGIFESEAIREMQQSLAPTETEPEQILNPQVRDIKSPTRGMKSLLSFPEEKQNREITIPGTGQTISFPGTMSDSDILEALNHLFPGGPGTSGSSNVPPEFSAKQSQPIQQPVDPTVPQTQDISYSPPEENVVPFERPSLASEFFIQKPSQGTVPEKVTPSPVSSPDSLPASAPASTDILGRRLTPGRAANIKEQELDASNLFSAVATYSEHMIQEALKGYTEPAISAVGATEALGEFSGLWKAPGIAKGIRKGIEEFAPTDKIADKWSRFMFSTIPRGIGYMGGLLTASAGMGVAAATRIIPLVTAFLNLEEGWESVKEAEIKDPKISFAKKFLTMAVYGGIGYTEALPLLRGMSRIDRGLGGKLFNKLADKGGVKLSNAIYQATEEAAQEVFAQSGKNAYRKWALNLEQDLLEGVAEGGAAGFVIGGFMGYMTGALKSVDVYNEEADAYTKELHDIESKVRKLNTLIRNREQLIIDQYFPDSDPSRMNWSPEEVSEFESLQAEDIELREYHQERVSLVNQLQSVGAFTTKRMSELPEIYTRDYTKQQELPIMKEEGIKPGFKAVEPTKEDISMRDFLREQGSDPLIPFKSKPELENLKKQSDEFIIQQELFRRGQEQRKKSGRTLEGFVRLGPATEIDLGLYKLRGGKAYPPDRETIFESNPRAKEDHYQLHENLKPPQTIAKIRKEDPDADLSEFEKAIELGHRFYSVQEPPKTPKAKGKVIGYVLSGSMRAVDFPIVESKAKQFIKAVTDHTKPPDKTPFAFMSGLMIDAEVLWSRDGRLDKYKKKIDPDAGFDLLKYSADYDVINFGFNPKTDVVGGKLVFRQRLKMEGVERPMLGPEVKEATVITFNRGRQQAYIRKLPEGMDYTWQDPEQISKPDITPEEKRILDLEKAKSSYKILKEKLLTTRINIKDPETGEVVRTVERKGALNPSSDKEIEDAFKKIEEVLEVESELVPDSPTKSFVPGTESSLDWRRRTREEDLVRLVQVPFVKPGQDSLTIGISSPGSDLIDVTTNLKKWEDIAREVVMEMNPGSYDSETGKLLDTGLYDVKTKRPMAEVIEAERIEAFMGLRSPVSPFTPKVPLQLGSAIGAEGEGIRVPVDSYDAALRMKDKPRHLLTEEQRNQLDAFEEWYERYTGGIKVEAPPSVDSLKKESFIFEFHRAALRFGQRGIPTVRSSKSPVGNLTEETIRKRIVTSAAQATPDATLKEQGKNPDDYHNTVDNDNEKEIAKDVKDLKNGVKYLENQRLVLDHLLNMPRIIRESLDPAEKRNWIRKMVTADKRYKRKTTEENKHEAWSIYEKWKMEARLDKALATVSKMEKDLENKNTECK